MSQEVVMTEIRVALSEILGQYVQPDARILALTGPMFCGKTRRAIQIARFFEERGMSVAAFCHVHDRKRYNEPENEGDPVIPMLASRDGSSFPARYYGHIEEIPRDLAKEGTQVFLWDEVNFCNPEHVARAVHWTRRLQRKVQGPTYLIGLGCDMYNHGGPFFGMASFMAVANQIFKFTSDCNACGEPAYITAKIGGSESQVEVGGDEIYRPMCPDCYDKIAERQ